MVWIGGQAGGRYVLRSRNTAGAGAPTESKRGRHLHLRQPTFYTEFTKFREAVIRTSGTQALRRLRGLLLFQICLESSRLASFNK